MYTHGERRYCKDWEEKLRVIYGTQIGKKGNTDKRTREWEKQEAKNKASGNN